MTIRSPDKSQTLNLLKDRGLPVETIIDVGVCHGTPELMRVWPDRKHILFEPVAEFTERITRTYKNIDHELHTVAVGEADGSIGLKVASVLPGMEISHSSMTNDSSAADPTVRTVRRVTLDSFLPSLNLRQPYLLKIDIDGHELQVLRGAVETLKLCSIVIVECQSSQLVQRIAAVQSAGFTLFDLCEPCYYDKVFWQCDAVFLRDEYLARNFKRLEGKVEAGMYESFRLDKI